MIITHVCRHWRQITLECSSLWTFIDCLSAPWVPIMLERSKEAALVVIYSAPSVPEYWPLAQLLSQLPRIKVLELCTFSVVVDRILDCLSSQLAPLLQIFEYRVLWSHDSRISIRPISDTIFQGRTPLLRSVELEECAFILTSRAFGGLQTLNLGQINPSPHLTLSQLLSALRCMPDLELLTLRLPSRISEDTELFDQILLTRLGRIGLDGAIRTAVSLFSHLVLPAHARIALYLIEIESPQSFSDLFSAIHKDPDGSFPIIRSLRVISRDTFCVQFSMSSANIRDSDIPLSFQFEYACNPAIIFDMCRMVPHSKIQNLSISTSLDLLQNFWHAGFAHLPELESIYLNRTSIAGFILALMTVGVSIAYPLLRTLELVRIDIGCDRPSGDCQNASRRWSWHTKTQIDGLQECNVQLLERVIVDVDWDH
ncbi:uncharacterized protein BJ212DRAFT_510183 [Suillus subaureus]|uniref:F-box domain-containing protein n=1 Tax=Suillus subaureus TaxID=48587 RepID=A0A9P7JAD2_9AGAM|nr:uncharacterized protein BJ212DRAFT_510183 [Suillus subaureus]KAG1811427.1 hypothetical protein BJ212DRAFT_510183 [Suillus subaureus]